MGRWVGARCVVYVWVWVCWGRVVGLGVGCGVGAFVGLGFWVGLGVCRVWGVSGCGWLGGFTLGECWGGFSYGGWLGWFPMVDAWGCYLWWMLGGVYLG